MPATESSRPYDDALAYLYGRINYERLGHAGRSRWRLKLDRMRRLLGRLGDPHVGLPIVHVAGTKGKGSTATMVAAALSEAGYATGLYTSPHLECLQQRMQINGLACSAEELVSLVDTVRPAASEMDRLADGDPAGQPTFFEITTAMALLHFKLRRVQAAVLEVGLGGRLDSTNVCRPLVSVITSISFDHTQQLGKTLRAIAGEKAGIIKPGVPVVSGVLQDEPRQVVAETAHRRQSPLRQLDEHFEAHYLGPVAVEDETSRASATIRGRMHYARRDGGSPSLSHKFGGELADLRLGLWGRHQAANAALAVESLLLLREQGWSISETALRRGLAAARCPARVEVVSQRPRIVLDVAHNVASVAALIETLEEYLPATRRTLIFATSKDKDARGMLQLLAPRFDRILLTRYRNNARCASLADLQAVLEEVVQQRNLPPRCVTLHDDPHEAVDSAIGEADDQRLLCVTGSFFLAAELRSVLLARGNAALLTTTGANSAGVAIPRAAG